MTDLEQLAKQLVDAEAEAARTAGDADADLLAANLEERLRDLDGRELLGEISAKDAGRARGNLHAERDSRVDASKRARRAADYVRDRLEAAAESAAEELLAEPTKDWQVAENARQKAAEVLAERERDVAEAQAKLAQADEAAEDIRCKFIASAASARADRENRKRSQIQWAIRQQSTLALEQIDEPFREEARAEMDRLAAESREIRAQREAEREFPRIESA